MKWMDLTLILPNTKRNSNTKDWTEWDQVNLDWLTSSSPDENIDLLKDRLKDQGLLIIKRKFYNQRQQRHIRIHTSIIVSAVSVVICLLYLNLKTSVRQPIKFDNASLAGVFQELEREYGLSITIEEPAILTCKFSGVLYNATPMELIQCLTNQFGLKVIVLNDGNYSITGCS